MPCNATFVTRSSPSRRYKGSAACWYRAREGQWGRKGTTKVGSRSTAASSTRARRRYWANPQALATEVQGLTRQTVYRIKDDPAGIACQTEKPIAASLPAIVDRHIPALDIPDFTQALMARPQRDGIPVSQNPAR